MTAFENWQVVLGIVQAGLLLMTFLGAFYIGLKQNEINERLRALQDYVALSVVPEQSGKIKVMNTGKTNVYLWGFDMPGNNQRFKKARLIPAGTMDSAWYWIDPPRPPDSTKTYEFEFKLYVTDEFNTKWISEHGGETSPTTIVQNGKRLPAFLTKVWSYTTHKFEWTLQE